MFQDEACKVLVWTSLAFSACVYYHTVALAVDRVVAILAPFWHRALNKVPTARRISVAISLGAFVLTSAELPFRRMDDELKVCAYEPSPPPLYFKIYIMSVMSYVPIIMLLFSNVIFIWALKQRRARRASSQNTTARAIQRHSNETSFTVMIIVTTCAFIALQFISFALFTESASRKPLNDGSADFFRTLARFPIVLNSSLNVVFYSSSKMFRKALRICMMRK